MVPFKVKRRDLHLRRFLAILGCVWVTWGKICVKPLARNVVHRSSDVFEGYIVCRGVVRCGLELI